MFPELSWGRSSACMCLRAAAGWRRCEGEGAGGTAPQEPRVSGLNSLLTRKKAELSEWNCMPLIPQTPPPPFLLDPPPHPNPAQSADRPNGLKVFFIYLFLLAEEFLLFASTSAAFLAILLTAPSSASLCRHFSLFHRSWIESNPK